VFCSIEKLSSATSSASVRICDLVFATRSDTATLTNQETSNQETSNQETFNQETFTMGIVGCIKCVSRCGCVTETGTADKKPANALSRIPPDDQARCSGEAPATSGSEEPVMATPINQDWGHDPRQSFSHVGDGDYFSAIPQGVRTRTGRPILYPTASQLTPSEHIPSDPDATDADQSHERDADPKVPE
jgi:hypothetical protein